MLGRLDLHCAVRGVLRGLLPGPGNVRRVHRVRVFRRTSWRLTVSFDRVVQHLPTDAPPDGVDPSYRNVLRWERQWLLFPYWVR